MRRHHDMGGEPAGPIDTADHAMEPWAKTLTASADALAHLVTRDCMVGVTVPRVPAKAHAVE